MSQNVPSPPPLPVLTSKTNISASKNLTDSSKLIFDQCLWANKWPELQKACYLARVCQINPPKQVKFRKIKAQLQVGPTCGLTALSMLLGGDPTQEMLLEAAKELHYTNNGEMFSANNLHDLVCRYFKPKCDQIEGICGLYKGVLNSNEIRKALLENACIFVPYPFRNFKT